MRTIHLSLTYRKHHGRTKRETQRGATGMMLSTALSVVFIVAIVVAGTWAVASYTGFVGAIGYAQAHGYKMA